MGAAKTEAEARFLFPGRPSDGDPDVLAAGTGDATTALLVFAAKSETGTDAEHIRWHQFEHMPEQFRITGVCNGQRWVSTPACRAARFCESPPFDRADHVVQYLFAEPAPQVIRTFAGLGAALEAAGRRPSPEPPRLASLGFDVVDRRANSRGVIGAYALPWYPASGIFLTFETAAAVDPAGRAEALTRLVETEGVAGAWRYVGARRDLSPVKSDPGQTATVFYLYDDPVAVAGRLRDAVECEWSRAGVRGLLAAPFHVVRPHDLDRHLP
jgi:hypothetical protein